MTVPAAYASAPQEPGPRRTARPRQGPSLQPGSPLRCKAPSTAAPLPRRAGRPDRCGNGEWRLGVLQAGMGLGAAPESRCGSPPPGLALLARCVRAARSGRGGVGARTAARHAPPQGAGRWAGRMVALGLVRPAAGAQPPQPPRRYDPLVHPVAVTEHCVIGDQIRVPAAWCDMAGCAARFADPAALGEANNRARALVAGWCADPVGRLVCPACQQRDGVTGPWRVPGHGVDDDRDPAPAAAAPAAAPGRGHDGRASVRPVMTRWRSTLGLGRHRRAPSRHLLAVLASDLSSWDAQQPYGFSPVSTPSSRRRPAGSPR
jgi:hypothetical protein